MDDLVTIEVWAVYDRPKDYPQGFIARKWLILPGQIAQPTELTFTADDLEGVRKQIKRYKPYAYRLNRYVHDDPKIVETWI